MVRGRINKHHTLRTQVAAALALVIFVGVMLCASMLLPHTSFAFKQRLIIIASENYDDQTVSKDELIKIFMGTKKTLNGKMVTRIAFQQDGETHQEFLDDYIGRGNTSFRNYWKRRVFTGKNPMPTYLGDDESVIYYVKTHDSAIGYIDPATPHRGVKVVRVID